MRFPSFEELAELLRTSARLKRNERIDPDTQIHRDLKVDEKRVTDVLNAIEQHFGIKLPAEIHNQLQYGCSVRSQDADESPVIQSLFAASTAGEDPWTAGSLYKAVLEELRQSPTAA